MTYVLITGGFGFVGSALARRCVALGHNVTLLSRSREKENNVDGLKHRAVIKDVRDIDEDDVAGVDWLFHCASTVDNYNVLTDPCIDTETNCLGTLRILEVCREFNPAVRIVYTSTFFVNGNLKTLPATPDSPCNPLGLYGATKLAAEHFCRVYHSVFGLNTVVARLVNVFGVGEQRGNNKKAAFNRMISLAVMGQEIELYGGGYLRDILYIDDAADGLVALMSSGLAGRTYYVGSGAGIPVREFAESAVAMAGTGTIREVRTPRFHLQTGIMDFWCDPSPLKDLGWRPQVDIREGIRRVIEDFRR